MDYLYFKWNRTASLIEVDDDLRVEVTVPRFKKSLHCFIWRLFTSFKGFYREYQLYRGDKKVSTAEVVSWLPIFPFMPIDGLHIGPCRTVDDERGKGYYPYLLSRIIEEQKGKNFYMIIAPNNIPSIRGVNKVGFENYAFGRKTKTGFYIVRKLL